MENFQLISSPGNPKVKELRALLRGRGPYKGGTRFAAEGMQLVTRALGSGIEVDYLVASEDVAETLPADLSELIEDRRVPLIAVPGSLFQRISRRSMAAGIALVGREPCFSFADLPADVPALVLDRVSNPRNIGAIARTCEAAGLGGLVLVGRHVDPFGYESTRASMGSVFGVPIVSCDEKGLLEWVASSSRTLIGTSGAAKGDLWDADLPSSSAIMFGNEGEGLPGSLIDACDELVKIPYNRAVDSLNLGAAVAVVAFEYSRRSSTPAPAKPGNCAVEALH